MRYTMVVVTAVLAASVPALAGVDVDLAGQVPLGDDARLFFSISSRAFDRDLPVVERVARVLPDPDDIAVALFLSQRSGRPADEIIALRARQLPWMQISLRLGVPEDAWFVPVESVPGPPYGRAYGYWKKHGSARGLVLTDREARDLVAVRMLHDYYGVPVDQAMRRRASGRDVRYLVDREYRSRHGQGQEKENNRGDEKGGKGQKEKANHGNGGGHGHKNK